jgi:hypothetical protein
MLRMGSSRKFGRTIVQRGGLEKATLVRNAARKGGVPALQTGLYSAGGALSFSQV